MPIQLLIEGDNHTAAAAALRERVPMATEVTSNESEKGLMTLATVIALFGAVGAGAKMVKEITDAAKSIAELAKLLIEWKRETAATEKTVLVKEEDGKRERLVLDAATPQEKVEEFLRE